MKKILITLNAALVVLALAILWEMPKNQTLNSSAAMAAPVPAALAVPMPARCPVITEAINTINRAQEELRASGHDFCGHKEDALRATRHAIDELLLAKKCDRCRE